jgi:glycosyltransferase involved in cell wall biosynthesis
VGVSKLIAEKLRRTPNLENKPAHYLPYGVPMPEAQPARNRPPQQPLRILYLGRLEQEQKRVRLFPGILAHLRAAGIPFEWTIAGEGPERPYLESVMKSDAHSQIRFTGALAYKDVPAILREHDIFLLASDFEGLPLSLLEGMGAGLVPVVSNIPSGVREVIHLDNGFLVELDNIKGYAEPIIHLHHHRDELLEKSRRSQEYVSSQFSVSAMTDRWIEEIFARTASNGASPQWTLPSRIAPPIGCEKSFAFSTLGTLLRRIRKKLG